MGISPNKPTSSSSGLEPICSNFPLLLTNLLALQMAALSACLRRWASRSLRPKFFISSHKGILSTNKIKIIAAGQTGGLERLSRG